jgi:hypothetical protein
MCLCSGVWAVSVGSRRASRLASSNRTLRVSDRRLSRRLLFHRHHPDPLRRGRASPVVCSGRVCRRWPRPYALCVSQKMVMRHTEHTGRATRLAAAFSVVEVGVCVVTFSVWYVVRWAAWAWRERRRQRLAQRRLAWGLWVACGRPAQFRPGGRFERACEFIHQVVAGAARLAGFSSSFEAEGRAVRRALRQQARQAQWPRRYQ